MVLSYDWPMVLSVPVVGSISLSFQNKSLSFHTFIMIYDCYFCCTLFSFFSFMFRFIARLPLTGIYIQIHFQTYKLQPTNHKCLEEFKMSNGLSFLKLYSCFISRNNICAFLIHGYIKFFSRYVILRNLYSG